MNYFGLFYAITSAAKNRKSLDAAVVPYEYDIAIDVSEEKFDGEVTILASAQDRVGQIRLNSKNLSIEKIQVFGAEDGCTPAGDASCSHEIQGTTFSESDEFVTIELPEPVAGKLSVLVKYSGGFSKLNGFYKSEYNGTSIFLTHFEPSDARAVFPCFDQPDLKAVFNISLVVPDQYMALSNSSEKSVEKMEGVNKTKYTFEKTPIMSTYLVAFVVGKLDYIEVASTVPIRVYATPDEKQWGQHALETASRCLKFFEEYFGIPYPLKKLDLVAIPSFAMGAMENWGLIIFRKTNLLFDESSSSIRSKVYITVTVCHEIAHMWFGNLVTMKWWNDLWLNEGFATWAASLAIDKTKIIDWDVWTAFINDDVESGMLADSLQSTHKVAGEVYSPDEIGQIFDAISYSKGSAIIKMLENWISPEKFQSGLKRYLKEFEYKNSVTSDLWSSLDSQVSTTHKSKNSSHLADAGKNNGLAQDAIASVIDPWIFRNGFPYLEVREEPDYIYLVQKRFTLGHTKENEPSWPIPIKIRWFYSDKGAEIVTEILMKDREISIRKVTNLYKINDDASGFYRVLYPSDVFDRIIRLKMSDQNRLNLLADSFQMGLALKGDFPIKHIEGLAGESNYEILSNVLGNVVALKSVFYDTPAIRDRLARVVNLLTEKRAGEYDLFAPPASIKGLSLASMLVSHAVIAGTLKVTSLDVHQEFKKQYFITVADEKFEEVKEFYINSSLPGQKEAALFALGTVKVKENLEKIFESISFVEDQDIIYLFAGLGSNLEFRNDIAEYFIGHFDYIKSQISDSGLLRRAIEYALKNVLQDGYREKALSFLDQISTDKSLSSAVEKCRNSIAYKMKIRKAFEGRHDF